MQRILFRAYKAKIQFRVGLKKIPLVQVEETVTETVAYERPSYLSFKTVMTEDEVDMLNQGGRPPAFHWKKVTPITDIN
ncbi:hypothetical protein SteCoe_23562 [Stentor coeruleus]|uniref:Uncharacterized protein n=1 Tax=Stentor coeruleus TaxID=5963 RepID=A0A1R2BJJ7_9CILI|nr:hypothetical protein SteCoe_23562 [Stentor coeruleus]